MPALGIPLCYIQKPGIVCIPVDCQATTRACARALNRFLGCEAAWARLCKPVSVCCCLAGLETRLRQTTSNPYDTVSNLGYLIGCVDDVYDKKYHLIEYW